MRSIKVKDSILEPTCPLEFMQIIGLSNTGCTNYSLQLSDSLTVLKFDCATAFVGKNLTYVIPKYLKLTDTIFEVLKPNVDKDIMVQNNNCISIIPTVIEVPNKNAYFINFPITENMIQNCDLILHFMQFDIHLSQDCNTNQKYMKNQKPLKSTWNWILSITLENDSMCFPTNCNENSTTPSDNNHSDCYSTQSGVDCFEPKYKCFHKNRVNKHWGTLQTLFTSRVFQNC